MGPHLDLVGGEAKRGDLDGPSGLWSGPVTESIVHLSSLLLLHNLLLVSDHFFSRTKPLRYRISMVSCQNMLLFASNSNK